MIDWDSDNFNENWCDATDSVVETYRNITNNSEDHFKKEIALLKWKLEQIAQYAAHDDNCAANDLDYLDHTACTCGLRELWNPNNRKR